MFDFLKIQYRLGKVTKTKLYKFTGNKITVQQYNEITGELYA